ncbi:MAG: RNA 2',3'-cyclic phosphodiesterase [Deltaproteobacteria bacterium]
MRAFVGIGLPEACRSAIARSLGPFRAEPGRVAWVRDRNLHLTLKFLGEIRADQADELETLLSRAAESVPPFDLDVAGAGAFPTPRAPRVLWVGIREPLELVGKLQQNIETALSRSGFPREDRPFHPHVTAGRVKGALPSGWGDRFVGALSGIRFGTVRAASFQLYESRLSPAGATYTVLREIPLGAGPSRTA